MPGFFKKQLWALVLLVLLGFPDSALTRKRDAIYIGFAGALTGPYADVSHSMLQGAMLAVDDINSGGEVLGKKLKLIVEDDGGTPEIGANVATKMANDGQVQFVIGHTTGGTTRAALRVYRAADILVISPSAGYDGLTRSGDYPNFFRFTFRDEVYKKILTQIHATWDYRLIPAIDRGMYNHIRNKYTRKFDTTPHPYAFNAYASVQVLAYAIEEAGSLDYGRVQGVLASRQPINTIFGRVMFDENGDLSGEQFTLFDLEDPGRGIIETPNPKDKDFCKKCGCKKDDGCEKCAKCE